jgi:transposase
MKMAKAYSNDLRVKFIEAHQQGDGSLEELAGQFHVSVGWAKLVSATFRRTGSALRPPAGKPGRRSKFTTEVQQRAREWIAAQPDLTLHQLQAKMRSELGLSASIGRLWSLLVEMGLRLKKSRSTPPSKTASPVRSPAASGRSKRVRSIRTG